MFNYRQIHYLIFLEIQYLHSNHGYIIRVPVIAVYFRKEDIMVKLNTRCTLIPVQTN